MNEFKKLRWNVGHTIFVLAVGLTVPAHPGETGKRTYHNTRRPIADPQPILADNPEFVQPIRERARFEAPPLIEDENADLAVRAWRFSMNARGIIEIPNRLRARKTAVIVVHPWGINDGQGWKIPEPAGFAFGTPALVDNIARHLEVVVNPFLNSMRGKVGLVMYSMRGSEDPIRRKLYCSIRRCPTEAERDEARAELANKLDEFSYEASGLPASFAISEQTPVRDYFRQFRGGMFGDRYNGPDFWDLPVPIHAAIDVEPQDVVIYDADGYPPLRDFLRLQGISHVLLGGYSFTKCYRGTTAGYLNLEQDFNVFLVGDGTLENTPMVDNVRFATSAAIAEASREHLITQISWIRPIPTSTGKRRGAVR